MNVALCEVVRFVAIDGYIYTGLLYKTNNAKATIIHIHGMCGNMLSFSSLPYLASVYQKNRYNLLTFNLKSHDCIAEGVYTEKNDVEDEFYYVGGSIEVFERRFIDIRCAIEFARQFTSKIILQGHSMGCESIIAFQITNKEYYDTILISPCDAYKLQSDYIAPNTINNQIEELGEFDDSSLLPSHFYGINCPTYSNIGRYTIPIYKKALYSILTGLALKIFRQDVDEEYFLPINCLCILGENDPMQMYNPDIIFRTLEKKFKNFIGRVLAGDHEMKPCQEQLGSTVLKWLLNQSNCGSNM